MNWQKELLNNWTTLEDLKKRINFSPDEEQRMAEILEQYPMSITPYYLSLIDFNDEHDPIRKMCIPSVWETDLDGSFDTSGEAGNTVISGMQHKYKQTAMILSTNCCAMYCRHCFRKRLVGLSEDEIAHQLTDMVAYIQKHTEISNVLISGGDAFLNSNQRIEELLSLLCDIEHLDYIRFGTRTPVVFPKRITEDQQLQDILNHYKQKKQIYVVTQFNHPREITPEAKEAIDILLSLSVPVKNQTVLLKGVNDEPEILGELLKKLTGIGVSPYYIFQCRPVKGVKNQFQVPIKKAYQIIEQAKNMQNGSGKCFRYCMSHVSGKIEILGEDEKGFMIMKYHEAKKDRDTGRIFSVDLKEDQAWLD